jgi:hypothetical protein
MTSAAARRRRSLASARRRKAGDAVAIPRLLRLVMTLAGWLVAFPGRPCPPQLLQGRAGIAAASRSSPSSPRMSNGERDHPIGSHEMRRRASNDRRFTRTRVQAARPVETHTAHIDSDTLIRALHAAERMPAAAQLRARSYQVMRLPPGAAVVDVGCGNRPTRFAAGFSRQATVSTPLLAPCGGFEEGANLKPLLSPISSSSQAAVA